MASQQAQAEVRRAAEHRLNAHLRPLTSAETELLCAAVEAGARMRTDSGYEDFLDGGPLPLTWASHSPLDGVWVDGWAAGADARRAAFYARLGSDLRPIAERVLAERVVLKAAA